MPLVSLIFFFAENAHFYFVLYFYLFFLFRCLGGNMCSLLSLIEINGQRFYYAVVVVVVLGFLSCVLVIAFN